MTGSAIALLVRPMCDSPPAEKEPSAVLVVSFEFFSLHGQFLMGKGGAATSLRWLVVLAFI